MTTKKKKSFSTKGQRADHLVPKIHRAVNKNANGAHPHLGIATLSYIINGEAEHFDSAGNYAKVYSGGVQWMKAGNGMIHDQTLDTIQKQTVNLSMDFNFG